MGILRHVALQGIELEDVAGELALAEPLLAINVENTVPEELCQLVTEQLALRMG
jgi:hypothetical protein